MSSNEPAKPDRRPSLKGQPLWCRIAVRMANPRPWWRTNLRSVKLRGPLKLALDYRREYVLGARGMPLP